LVEPTGISGVEYSDTKGPAEDTYELSIMLPQIGNTISQIWDIIYGEPHLKDTAGRILLGGENSDLAATEETPLRNTHLEWNSSQGERMLRARDENDDPYNGYNPKALNTLAGTLNSVHDLMGMIIVEKDNIQEVDADTLDSNNIYYDATSNKYYFKDRKYLFSDNEEDFKITDMVERPNKLYRAKSFDFIADNKTGEIDTANNYYLVLNNEEISEDCVYGDVKPSAPNPELTQENYNPESENPDE